MKRLPEGKAAARAWPLATTLLLGTLKPGRGAGAPPLPGGAGGGRGGGVGGGGGRQKDGRQVELKFR